jgi:DNA topoisomerase-1
MRTDSVNLSEEALKDITKYIKKTYGENYHHRKNYTTKSKNTQEAHESVRPTHIEVVGLSENGKIGSDETKLYNLIWKRSIASQMSSAKLNVATTQISISKTKDYYFQSDISSIIFDGFLKVYNIQNLEEESAEQISGKMPKLDEKLKLTKLDVNQDYQRPLPRYNEASLVNKLDPKNLNIGRPSTYAAIITKIQERGYVEKRDNEGIKKSSLHMEWNSTDKKIEENVNDVFIGKDTGKLSPTAIGKVVTDFLVSYFADLMDYKFTSNMETKLDSVAEGKLKMLKLMDDFYSKEFHPIIEKLNKEKIKYVDKDQRVLGQTEEGYNVIATVRRFGPVVMIDNNGKTVNIAPLKEPNKIETVTLEEANKILSYPKTLGKIDRKDVKLYKGKYGLYAKVGDKNINLSGLEEDEITIEKITEKLTETKSKNLWEGKDGKVNYVILEGPFGKYINIKDSAKKTSKPMNIKLPTDTEIKDLTLEKVKEIVEKGKINKFKGKGKFKKQ